MTEGQKGSALAELRARGALKAAGLDPAVPVERASSVTNEVWLTATHVVRINRTRDGRLAREAVIADLLPPAVGYPTVIAHGRGTGEDWLVAERVPGAPLAHQWPDLGVEQRRRAVEQLAARLSALHATKAPAELPPIAGTPQLLEVGSFDPSPAVVAALERAARLDHVDPLLLQEAIELVERLGSSLQPFSASTFVHGDVTFENVLWDGDEVTALLDVEWARPGPRDLDLDIILRCCAYPKLHVAEHAEARTRPEDYADVPIWLTEAYPGLFSFPRQADRLRVYSIAYDVRELLAFPPAGSVRDLSEQHPYHRLARVVEGRSYLDDFARAAWTAPASPRRRRRPGPGSSP